MIPMTFGYSKQNEDQVKHWLDCRQPTTRLKSNPTTPQTVANSSLHHENPVHPLAHVLQESRVIQAGRMIRRLGDGPAMIADFPQRLHDLRPVVVPFEVIHVETLPQPQVV